MSKSMGEIPYVQKKWGSKKTGRTRPTREETDTIDRAVAAATVVSGVDPGLIVGWRRMEDVVDLRFVVYDLCWESGLFTQSSLGRCFGRDHVTIKNGVDKVKERIEDKTSAFRRFRELYAEIREKYKEYEKDPERMVQELCLHDGRQGDDLSPEERLRELCSLGVDKV